MENLTLTVSECIALVNQTLEYAYPTVIVEGEVSSFKLNKDKYVFFDLKDSEGTLNCFMMVYQLRTPLEDGMRIQVMASPKLTKWGRFSLTVREVRLVGEGTIKRSFELLRQKLDKEGLFAPERKRLLPEFPVRIGLVTSTGAAGYVDFTTILNQRWGGMDVRVANVQVQGADAPGQIVKAIEYFNQSAQPPEVLVIVRGGGSADDLAAFNDEPLVRAIASSRIPTLVGVGHEVDITLADLAADVRAATPTNAAQLLVPDRREISARLDTSLNRATRALDSRVKDVRDFIAEAEARSLRSIAGSYQALARRVSQASVVLTQLDPRMALNRGYALVRAQDGSLVRGTAKEITKGQVLTIELSQAIIKAGVQDVSKKGR
jgi:exodeoxyribonuclease VII large subunit